MALTPPNREEMVSILDEILKERFAHRLASKVDYIVKEAEERLEKEVVNVADEICKEVLSQMSSNTQFIQQLHKREEEIIIKTYFNDEEVEQSDE